MKNTILYTLFIITVLSSCGTQKINYEKYNMSKEEYSQLEDGLYAYIKTNKGNMLVEFFEEDAPLTVANFVGLAEGTKSNTAKEAGEPFYNGLQFHRVMKDFMIQGGDPQGNGMGGPGYKFKDEKNDKKHDGKGVLSMANSGPNTNGSQFFITEVPTPWLDGKHTIFGKVVDGLEVIDSIVVVPTNAQDRPQEPVTIEEVSILRKGDKYKEYNANESFANAEKTVDERNQAFEEKQKAKEAAEKAEKVAKMQSQKEKATTTDSGLQYVIVSETDDAKPNKGDNVSVHYTGMLEDGTVFDSSYERKEPISFPVGMGRVIKGWDEGILLLNKGEKAVLFIPSELGYGSRGAGGVIPPNANLVFEVELVDIQ